MMLHRLKTINKNQRGFTLIELIIVIALSGVITGAITMAIFQVISISARSDNHMIAVKQVQNAGYWVSLDAQMAQSIELSGTSTFVLTLTWINLDDDDKHEVVYSLEDKKLQREYYINPDPDNPIPNATTIVAEYIVPDQTNFKFTGGSTFRLPDVGDEVTITDSIGGDSGVITVTTGSIQVTKGGDATYQSSTGAWTTPSADDTIILKASQSDTTGSLTATTGTATAAITADVDDGVATVTCGKLIFTVTAAVGDFPRVSSETRVYEIVPRPS